MCKIKLLDNRSIKNVLTDQNIYTDAKKFKLEFISTDNTEYLELTFLNYVFMYDSLKNLNHIDSTYKKIIYNNESVTDIDLNNLLLSYLLTDKILYRNSDFKIRSMTIYF